MNELYSEHIVKRKTTMKQVVLKGILIGLTILLAVLGLLIPALILAVISFFVLRNLDLEFEYLYVSGELDIDKIMAKSKRKKVISLSLENMEIIAPENAHQLDSYKNRNYKVMDFTSLEEGRKIYVMIVKSGSEMLKVLLEPSEKMMLGMQQSAPRKVIL